MQPPLPIISNTPLQCIQYPRHVPVLFLHRRITGSKWFCDVVLSYHNYQFVQPESKTIPIRHTGRINEIIKSVTSTLK